MFKQQQQQQQKTFWRLKDAVGSSVILGILWD